MHNSLKHLVGGVWAALLAAIWFRPEPPLLRGVDAACYAGMARDLAERPWTQWPRITWAGGGLFYDHPPLALWLESFAFRFFGAVPSVAVALTRLYATGVAILVFLTARELAGSRVAIYALVGLGFLSGFLAESQNPMLEMPLTFAMALAIWGAVLAYRSPRWGSGLFVLGFVSAAFIKGPPALALLAPLLWTAAVGHGSWRWMAVTTVTAAVALVAALGAFESARRHLMLPPWLPTYWAEQVMRSATHGRNNPNSSLFFYGNPLMRYYLSALMSLPIAVWATKRSRGLRQLIALGALWSAAILGGFSLTVQKYAWYIHPVMIGSAWFVGGALSTLVSPTRDRYVCQALMVWTALYVSTVVFFPGAVSHGRPEMEALHRLPPPLFASTEPRRVAYCGMLGAWQRTHLVAFFWRAAAVGCDEQAPFRFDGTQLVRTTDVLGVSSDNGN